jgi:hypothetical protein
VHKRARLGEIAVKRGTISLSVRPEDFYMRSNEIVRSLPTCSSGHMIAAGSKLVLSPRSVLGSRSNFMRERYNGKPHTFKTLTVPINASFARGRPLANEPLECNTPTYIETPFCAVRSANGSTNVTTSVSNTRLPSRCVAYIYISVHLLETSSHNLTHVGARLPATGGFW